MSEQQTGSIIFLDGLGGKVRRSHDFDFPLAQYVRKHKKKHVLFSKKGIIDSFFTRDSKLYLTPEELKLQQRREKIVRMISRLDSLSDRNFAKNRAYAAAPGRKISLKVRRQYAAFREKALKLTDVRVPRISLVQMWNFSIISAVIFGMFTMTMIYRYLGQSVSAKIESAQNSVSEKIAENGEKVMGVSTEADGNLEIDPRYITQLLRIEDVSQSEFEKEILAMVKGYPIEKMVPLIAKKDRIVAAFIVGIARQESSWGKRVPVYQGQDCWNYWGWRGKNAVGTGGHTCFANPQDAVDTVAKRLEFLIKNQNRNTPEKMIIWKCGDCSWDKQENMQRWISSVSTYFHKLNTD